MNIHETGIEQYIKSYGIHLGHEISRQSISSNINNLKAINIPGLTILEDDPTIIDCWHFLFPSLSLHEIHEVLDYHTVTTNNPSPGDIAVYFKKEMMHPWQRTHGARTIDPGTLISKWGEKYPYICRHELDLVPSDYGSIAIYLSLPSGLK